ncbi:MAG TPA: hypothetical protein VJR89_22810 [Polyangiales bacterium]|nr:hypothetical protein [Polyangiales bacterium]
MSRALRRTLRLLGRILRITVLCLAALGPGAPPPPPTPRRDPEAQVDGSDDDERLP